MKKLTTLILTMVLALACVGDALAFFEIEETANENAVLSYAAVMNAMPVIHDEMEDGRLKEVFVDVSRDAFEAYGEALENDGYAVLTQETINGVYSATIGKAAIQFDLEYGLEDNQLTLVYPVGVTVEAAKPEDPFEGYIVIEPGVQVKMFNTIKAKLKGTFTDKKPTNFVVGNVIITAEMVNILQGKVLKNDSMPQTDFHYINEDGHYTYACKYVTYGYKYTWDDRPEWSSALFKLGPLDQTNVTMTCSLPNTVLKDENPSSIFALTFEMKGSTEKYVIFLDRAGSK